MNRVVNLRAAPPRRLEAEADLDALDRLHGHHGLRDPAVELAIPLRMRAEADRQAVDPHLDHAAEGVALLADAVDELRHLRITFGMERIDGACIAEAAKLRQRARPVAEHDTPELRHPAGDLDAEGGEQLAGQRASRDSCRRLAGARPLEDRADTAQMLDRAGQVGVAGTRPIDVLEPLELGVFVDHLERERAAERHAVPEA